MCLPNTRSRSREEKFRGGEGSHRCSCSNHGGSQASPSDEKPFSSPQTEHYGAVPPGVKVQGQLPYNRDEKEDWVGVNEKELGGMRGAAGA